MRGLRFRGVSTRALRDILGASKETALFDYVNNSAPMAMVGAGGYMAPTSVVAPGLLFDEIEFELSAGPVAQTAAGPGADGRAVKTREKAGVRSEKSRVRWRAKGHPILNLTPVSDFSPLKCYAPAQPHHFP